MRSLAWAMFFGLTCVTGAGCLDTTPPETASIASEVIGGGAAPFGKWPDVAAVNFDGLAGCTGTLIAPTIVLTAGHCNAGELDSVLVGTASLAQPDQGETIDVVRRVEFESTPGAADSFETEDLLVLQLERASQFAPRAIATGWARFDIENGAEVTIAGYGGIDEDSTRFVPELQEAVTTITDADCVEMPGCNALVAPGGELGAGGMGIDTCQGDSGGPLYLMTEYGNFLAGATSRAYDDATTSCKDGGIYARPDKVIDWIERSAGVPVSRAPEPTATPITVLRGDGGETQIEHNDPRSKSHAYALTTPPMHGTAKVRSDGRVRMCADPAYVGADSVGVTVTDKQDPSRTIAMTITVSVADGVPGDSCSVDDFVESGGCCDSGRGGSSGSLLLGLGVLAMFGRRSPRSR